MNFIPEIRPLRAAFLGRSAMWRVTALLCVAAAPAFAQSPTGGAVAAGSAQITQSATQTEVTQSSQRAVIDWQSFDVGRDHTVVFQQPGRASATLNRVQLSLPSLIEGAIQAPGTVIIQNTAGVTFSGGARVDAGGLLATSQTVDADHFLNTGNFRIGGGERPGARIDNAGQFTIGAHGLAALVGSNVTNSGVIEAQFGTVVLASGETTTIDLAGDGVFQVAVSGAPEGGQITQSGRIDVGGGRVMISAGGASDMLDAVINTTGVTRAVSSTGAGGHIQLHGRGGGAVRVAGTLDASGATSGGRIEVTGETVDVSSSAQVQASGARGGEIFIGGALQGQGDLRNARRTVLAMGSEIRADGQSGPGGTVIVWSDGTTWFDGLISTQGTTAGGFVETSGKVNLGTGNMAEVIVGPGGQWLLDPRNVRIANTGTDVAAGTVAPPDAPGTFTIRRASITNALNTGADVTVTTAQPGQTQAGTIIVDTAVRWNGAGTLALEADSAIQVNRPIEARGDGGIRLNAGTSIEARNSLITRGLGDITLQAGTTVDTRALQATGSGKVSVTATGDVITRGTVEARQTARIDIRTDGAVDLRGTVQTRQDADIIVNAGTSLTTRGVRSLNDGDITLTAGDALTTNATVEARGDGSITLDAGGDVDLNRNLQTRGAGNIDLTAAGDIAFDRNVQALGTGSVTVRGGGDLTVSRTAQTRGGDFTVNIGGDLQLQRAIVSRDGGSVRADAGGSIFVNRDTRMRGTGDLTFRAGDRIEVNQQVRHDGDGSLTLEAQNDVRVNQNVFARGDGDVTVTSRSGDILFGGANGNQRISSNRGDVTLNATTGSMRIERTNTRPRRTEIYASNGNIAINAGTEILLQGGASNGSLARIGRTSDASTIQLNAPTVSILGGDVSNRGTAQVIAGRGGAISVNADLLQIETGDTGALASIDAVNGASLTLDATTQRWDGRVRADGTGPTGGDVRLTGDISATVAPVFDLNDGAEFALNPANPAGSLAAPGIAFEVTTTGGQIGIDGSLGAAEITLLTDTGVTLGAGTEIAATGPGDAIVISAADLFRNAAGADVFDLSDPAARWLLYLNRFDSLEGTRPNSGTFDLYNRAFAATPAGSLGGFAGNRIVYGEHPTLTLRADDLDKTYGTDGAALLTATPTGLRPGDTLATALSGTVGLTSPGADAAANVSGNPYTITTTATPSNQGYAVVVEDGTLTVRPAPLTVTADDASRPVGGPNPAFTATFDGFVLGQGIAVLDGALTFSTPATPDSPDGTFAVTPSGLSATNYALTFVDGALTVGTGTPPVLNSPPTLAAAGSNNAGALSLRLAGRRGTPLTPGDASFRISNRDFALASADPFSLSYSLGEVVTFATVPERAPAGSFVPATGTSEEGQEGFIPAAGPADASAEADEGFVAAAGDAEPSGDTACGASVNLGGLERGGCQAVTVSESYWSTR